MSGKIRRATREDADFLAWVMLTASRAHVPRGPWDLIIGADEAGCLEYLKRLAVAEPRSMCHYDSFMVAEIGGRPAAALCGFRPGEEAWVTVGKAMANVQHELGWTEQDVALSQQRVAPIGACFPPDAGADWCIDFVATLPEYRRPGSCGCAAARGDPRRGPAWVQTSADPDFHRQRRGSGGVREGRLRRT